MDRWTDRERKTETYRDGYRDERTCITGVQVTAAARRRRRLRLRHDGGDRGDNTTAHDEWCTTTDVSGGAAATGELPVVTRRGRLCSGGSGDAHGRRGLRARLNNKKNKIKERQTER